MKKSLLTLLAILMILSMAVSVMATTDGGSAAVSTAAGQPGEIVYLTVSLADVPDATSIGVSVEGLPVKGALWVQAGTMKEFVLAENIGAWANETAVSVNGDVLDLAFEVPEAEGTKKDFPVTVTIQVMNGSELLLNSTVTGKVRHHVAATNMTLNKSSLAIDMAVAKTAELVATVTPADHTEKVVWTSDNKDVVTVADGVVTAHKVGTANITVTAGDITKTCAVTVTCAHTNATKVAAKGASCKASGNKEHWNCGDCGQLLELDKKTVTTVEAVKIPMLDHTYSKWETNEAQHWRTCTVCGTEDPAKNHEYVWKTDKEATEHETGLKHEECVCGLKRSENTVIEKLDHVHTDITHHEAVAGTCVKPGTVEHWTCGSEKCAGKYYADKDCKTLLASVSIEIDPANHTGNTKVKDAVDATCEKDGYSGDIYCADCGVKLENGAAIEKLGHAFRWVVDKYPSEWSEGKKHEECSRCKEVRSENTVIGKLIHNPKRVDGVAPTCLEDGVAEHFYCANCGKYYAVADGKIGEEIAKEDTVLAATGHQFGDQWQQDEKDHWKVCVCGEVSEKAAHTLEVKGAVEATETEEGYTGDQVCSVCQHVVTKGETIPCLGEEETTEAPAVDEPKEEGSPVGGIIAIVVGVIAVCGGGIFFVVKKGKKN